MQVTTDFLKAKKDKSLSAFLVLDRPNTGKIMRLCLDVKLPYSDKTEMVFIECPTEIYITNYDHNRREVSEICFHTFFSRYHDSNYIETFLNNIKKDSDITFRIVAFNGSDFSNRNNLVCHKLIGFIGTAGYLLAEYTGADNTASPIQWKTSNTCPV